MKVRADEHVSPEIIDSVRRISLGPGWTLDHVNDVGDRGSLDEHWITRFANEGGNAILSADTDFTSKAPQLVAVFNTGMKVIHLPAKWSNARGYLQASHILFWWPRIEHQIENMNKRECYRPSWHINMEAGQFKKVELDFAKAHKKDRKAKRRTK